MCSASNFMYDEMPSIYGILACISYFDLYSAWRWLFKSRNMLIKLMIN